MNDMVKCRCDQHKKMMDFDYREDYLKGVYQAEDKKTTFSFSSD